LRIPIGINIGKNKDTAVEEATKDYRLVFERLYELGDYFVVNVSSPNTPGLRNLQAVSSLKPLLTDLSEWNTRQKNKPLFVKIAPDLADEDIVSVGKLTRELGMAGVVAGNTTINRALVPRAGSLDRGGLSGPPQFARTRDLLRLLKPELRPDQVLIAAGGVSNPDDVAECIRYGATLVQVYTAFIYLGPRCAHTLTRTKT
jgi:dihydroorotate dehydrogenase